MKNVDVAQLFQALELASRKTVTYMSGRMSDFYGGNLPTGMGRAMYSSQQTSFGLFDRRGAACQNRKLFLHRPLA
ncbi:MAG: hypothetical protein FJ398_06150 [Verrucomicrobia bacterium]|nr:hypothetical protein [Verrucomicrobiota bacterium]